MATTAVDIVVKVAGGQKLKALDQQLKGTASDAVKASSGVDKFANSTRKLKGADGAARSVNKLGNAAQTAGNQAQAASGKLNNFGKSIRNVLGGFALLQGAQFIFGKTAEFERTEKQLATVVGDLGRARGIIKELQVINRKSPFSLLELTQATKQLSAFGVEEDKLVSTTERLGKISAATGADILGIGLAYGQVLAKGKLQTEELNQFQERGIPLRKELAKLLEVDEQKLTKLIETGRVGFPVVEQAIKNLTSSNGQFGQAFENTADTLDAKLSNAIDSLGRAAAAFGELLKPEVIKILQDFEGLLTSVTGFLKGIPQPAADAAIGAAKFAAKVLLVNKAIKILIGFKSGIVGVLTSTATNATLAGNASATAAGKVGLLAARLKTLAAIGIVTVGVEFLVNSAKAGASLESEIQKLEAGGTGATFGGASRETVINAQKVAKTTQDQIKKELAELTKPNFLRDLAGGIPGVGPLIQGGRGKRIQQLNVRNANAQSVLDLNPNDFKSVQEAQQEELKKFQDDLKKSLLDGITPNGSGFGGGGGGAGAAASAEDTAAELLREQTKAGDELNEQLQRRIDLQKTQNEFDKQLLQNGFDFKDLVGEINTTAAPFQRDGLIKEATVERNLKDLEILKNAAADFGAAFGEEVAGKLPEVNNELTKTEELLGNAFNVVSGGLQNGIQGLIDGSKEFNDVLSDILKNLGNLALQFAFNSLGSSLNIPGFAEGGRPNVGKVSLVGEKGPELFIPDTAGTVVPNDQAFGDARNALVNTTALAVDDFEDEAIQAAFNASRDSLKVVNNQTRERQVENSFTEMMMTAGSSQDMNIRFDSRVINSVEYVTAEQFQKGIVESAKEARAQVFSDLKNKPSVRRSVGMS